MSDLELLREYEPVARFTRGELFFPTAVGAYAAQCSLWATDADGSAACLVPAGRLSLEGLCEEALGRPDAWLSLRFVQRPLSRVEVRRWRREPRERLRAAVRFTTTGMFGRLVDAAFRASLLWRGTVGARLTPAAEPIGSGSSATASRITGAWSGPAGTYAFSTGSSTP